MKTRQIVWKFTMMDMIRVSRRYFSLPLLAATVALLGGQAHATSYYWDCTSPIESAGFGTASGTWGTSNFWSTSNAGTLTPGIQSPTVGDDLNFGYTVTGIAAGTVNVGTVSASNLTFAANSGAIALSGGTITLPTKSTITVNNPVDTISSVITGASTSLTKSGTGVLTLDPGAGNTDGLAALKIATGTLILNSGTLNITTSGGYVLGGSSNPTNIINGGNLRTAGGVAYVGGDTPGGKGFFTINSGTWTNAGGFISIQYGAAGNGSIMNVNGGQVVSPSSIQLGQNSGTSTLNLNGGTVIVDRLFNSGSTAVLNLNGGVLQPTAASANFINFPTGGSVNVLTNGAVFNTAGFNITIAAALKAGSPSGGLTKLGAGMLTLSGTNTYTGATTVSNGTLLVNSPGSIASAATVNSGATLGGSGTISNNVTVSGGTLSLGASVASAGTLTIKGNLSLASGSTATFDLAGTATVGSGVNDLIQLTGTARDLTLNNNPVTVNPLAPLAVGTNYTLITFTGTRSGSLGTVSGIGRQPANITYDDTPSAGKVMVSFGAATPAGLVWNSSSSSVWDVTTTPNWSNTATFASDVFYQSDIVTFDDTPGVQTNITLNTTVTPSTVTVNSIANAFSISGTGKISGGATLTKSGGSTFTVSNANDYVGTTTINGGTLEFAGSSSIADASAIALNGGSVKFSGGGTRGGLISGAGNLVKAGANTLTLSGSNSYDGVTTLAAGTLSLAALTNGGFNSPIGAAPSAAANLVFSGGALSYSGATASSDRGFTLAYGTNVIAVTSAAAALTLTGGCPTNTVFFKKLGAGTLVLDPGAGSVYSLGSISADDGTLILKSGTVTTTRTNPDVVAYGTGVGARGGKLVVDGATLNMGSGTLKPGAAANGTLDILSGTVNVYSLALGHNGTVTSTQSGGNVTATELLHYDGGTATHTMTGGTLTVQKILNWSSVANTPFTFIMNGGIVRAAAGTGNLFDNAGKVGPEVIVQLGTSGATIDTSLSSATIVRPLIDMPGQMGRLTKIGTNTLSLTATNTYSGATVVSNGVLRLTHTQVLAATNEVYIAQPGMINLDFDGTNIIRKLYINGEPMTVNKLYGQYNRPASLSGNGYLLPTEGPKPKGTLIRLM